MARARISMYRCTKGKQRILNLDSLTVTQDFTSFFYATVAAEPKDSRNAALDVCVISLLCVVRYRYVNIGSSEVVFSFSIN